MIKIFNKYSLYICTALLILVIILIYLYYSKECICVNSPIVKENKSEENIIDTYYVDIKGEVINPGVYKIEATKRLIDVISLAGGLTENSDITLLNLSKKVIDEMNITIYSKEEVKKAKESLKEEPTVVEVIKEIEKECICPSINDACINNNNQIEIVDTKLVNINTASLEELMEIPKIGEAKAKSIIEYRNVTKFNTIDDIKNVSGIGEKLFDSIKEYITI